MGEMFTIGSQQEVSSCSPLILGSSIVNRYQGSTKPKTKFQRLENRNYLDYIRAVVTETSNETKEETKTRTSELDTKATIIDWCSWINSVKKVSDTCRNIELALTLNVNNLYESSIRWLESLTSSLSVINEIENIKQKRCEKRWETYSYYDPYNAVPKNLLGDYNNLVTHEYLDEMLQDLKQLLGDNDYNEDYLKPTNYAVESVESLFTSIKLLLKKPFPRGTIYPDGDGGLRVEWMRDGIELRLIISATEKGKQYIYYELENVYAVEYNVTPNNLSNWLEWFNHNDPSGKSTMGSIKL